VTESREPNHRLESFDDLAGVDNEVLRQIGARVHVMDLAYAFGSADPALLDRLLGALRPGLASDIRSGVKMMEVERQRFPLEEQIRLARARVLDIARSLVEEPGTGAPGTGAPGTGAPGE
jgi:FliG C-terminal domain